MTGNDKEYCKCPDNVIIKDSVAFHDILLMSGSI
jgi:hypothetical protein